MISRLSLSLMLSVSLLLAPVLSQANPTDQERTFWDLGFDLGSVTLDSAEAEAQGVEDGAGVVAVTANYNRAQWLISLGLDVVVYEDTESFTVIVRDTFGDEFKADSDASGVVLSAAAGPQWYFGSDQQINLFAQAGLAAMVKSEREISQCSDCPSQDIELDAGPFVMAGANYYFNKFGIGLLAHQYLSGDLNSSLRVRFSLQLR